jgi:hypothetical protein
MAANVFAFLRGTCFRFAAQSAALLPELARHAVVPSCGDAHLQNFGTWRDIEGRLVWGANDLDEAALLPWTADLLRLATSALLARRGPEPRAREIAATLLDGYARHLAAPRAFVLDEAHAALRDFVVPDAAARARFWAGIDRLAGDPPPAAWQAALAADLPPGAIIGRFAARQAGLGSLGRPRFVVVAEWGGGRVVREAKSRVPSAWLYAGFPGAAEVDPLAIANGPGRAPDPWLRLSPALVIRRLAPDSRRLEGPGGDPATLLTLLEAMGGEIGNLHGGGRHAHVALAELRAMPVDWLRDAAKRLAEAVAADHATLAAKRRAG